MSFRSVSSSSASRESCSKETECFTSLPRLLLLVPEKKSIITLSSLCLRKCCESEGIAGDMYSGSFPLFSPSPVPPAARREKRNPGSFLPLLHLAVVERCSILPRHSGYQSLFVRGWIPIGLHGFGGLLSAHAPPPPLPCPRRPGHSLISIFRSFASGEPFPAVPHRLGE